MQTMQNRFEKLSAFHYTVHTETLIDAPAERVWAILMDPPELAKWSTSFQGMQGELKPGGTVKVRFMFMGRMLEPVHALKAFEANRIFAW